MISYVQSSVYANIKTFFYVYKCETYQTFLPLSIFHDVPNFMFSSLDTIEWKPDSTTCVYLHQQAIVINNHRLA